MQNRVINILVVGVLLFLSTSASQRIFPSISGAKTLVERASRHLREAKAGEIRFILERKSETAQLPDRATSTADEFAQYETLAARVLMTLDERHEYEEKLADPVLIQEAAAALMNVAPFDPESKSSRNDWMNRRLRFVDFLTKSVQFRDNPSRATSIEAVSRVIQAARAPSDASEHVRRAVAGDRIELALALKDSDPEIFSYLGTASKRDKNTAKIIRYANNFYSYQMSQGVQK